MYAQCTIFVLFAEWGTGVNSKACDVTMKQQIDKRLFDWSTVELRSNGYFYASGENTTSSLTYLSQVRPSIDLRSCDMYNNYAYTL